MTQQNAPCDRCGQTPTVVQTFCRECGPIPLCGDCTTAHVVELRGDHTFDRPEADHTCDPFDAIGARCAGCAWEMEQADV